MKIMFVCHGNICRSPMAELVMRDLLKKNGLADKVQVSSCATSTEEIWNGVGSPVYPPARAELLKHGISCEGKLSARLSLADYEKYDLFVGMDSANIRNMKAMLGGDPEGKVHKLMDYTARGGDVADPWYTDRFDIAYRDIYEGCSALLEKI